MAAIPRADYFPTKCPSCAAQAGFPFKATTSPDSSGIEVALRCHVCRTEWLASLTPVDPNQPTAPLVFAPR